jgi:hypothetical protein
MGLIEVKSGWTTQGGDRFLLSVKCNNVTLVKYILKNPPKTGNAF